MDKKEKNYLTSTKKLSKEIKKLERKKLAKDEMNDLFDKRNRLKFPLLYKLKGGAKKMAQSVAKSLDEASKKQEEKDKKEAEANKDKPKEKDSDEIYDAMFGESELEKQMLG